MSSSSANVGNPPIAVIKTDPDAPPPEVPQPTPLTDMDQERRAMDVVDSYESILTDLGYSDVLAPISQVTLDVGSLPERIKSSPEMLLGLRTQIYSMELIRRMQNNVQEASDSHQCRPIMINGVTSLARDEMLSPSEEPEHSAKKTASRREKSPILQKDDNDIPTDQKRIDQQKTPIRNGINDSAADDIGDYDESPLPIPSASPSSSSRRQESKDIHTDKKRVKTREPPTDGPPFKCSFCKEVFEKNGIRNRHVSMAHKIKPHECNHCPKRFNFRKSLCRHVQECHDILPTGAKMERHAKNKAHKVPDPTPPGNPTPTRHLQIVLSRCDEEEIADSADDGVDDRDESKSSNVAALTWSSSQRQNSSSSQQDEHGLPTVDQKRAKKKGIDEPSFKCSACNKAFNKKGNLHRHLLMTHNTKPYKCEHCPKRCQFWRSLCHHMKRRHNILPTGAKMGRPVNNKARKVPDPTPPGNPTPTRHLRIVLNRCDEEEVATDPERYICVCGKKFSCVAELKVHRQTEPHAKSS